MRPAPQARSRHGYWRHRLAGVRAEGTPGNQAKNTESQVQTRCEPKARIRVLDATPHPGMGQLPAPPHSNPALSLPVQTGVWGTREDLRGSGIQRAASCPLPTRLHSPAPRKVIHVPNPGAGKGEHCWLGVKLHMGVLGFSPSWLAQGPAHRKITTLLWELSATQ